VDYDYVDNFHIRDVVMVTTSGNAMTLDNCDEFLLDANYYDNGGGLNYAGASTLTTCTDYMEDGHHKDEVTFCASTAESTRMQKRGWSLLTNADGRFIKADNDQNGAQVAATEHNHQWFNDINQATYQSDGSTLETNIITEEEVDNNNDGSRRYVVGQIGNKVNINGYTKNATGIEPAHYTLIALKHR